MRNISIKATKGEGLKILSPKQMLQRLLIALAQVKGGNTSQNLLHEFREIRKEIKKVYDNIIQ